MAPARIRSAINPAIWYDAGMVAKNVRTTISLPEDLLKHADRFVREGVARSRGELLVDALRHELRRLERERIDDEIRQMAQDEQAMRDNREIQEDFEGADREAWQMIRD